jgi:hypothetical protein
MDNIHEHLLIGKFWIFGLIKGVKFEIGSRSHLKIKILVQDPPLKPSGIKRRGRVLTRPVKIPGSSTRILKYVEDLKRGSNAEACPPLAGWAKRLF